MTLDPSFQTPPANLHCHSLSGQEPGKTRSKFPQGVWLDSRVAFASSRNEKPAALRQAQGDIILDPASRSFCPKMHQNPVGNLISADQDDSFFRGGQICRKFKRYFEGWALLKHNLINFLEF
jgi:hypothetical protein